MQLNKIEIDKLEDLHYAGGEANKRSVQFREVAGRLNDAIDEIERMKKPNWLHAVIGLIVIGGIIWLR
jgi:hypothetical protein